MAEEIIQVIDALCSKFGIAIDWSAENVIPYITELSSRYANYVIVSNAIYLVIYAIFIFAGVKSVKWIIKTTNGDFDDWSIEHEVEAIVFIVFAIIYAIIMFSYSLILIFCIIPEIIQAVTMPEIVFFNKVMSYLN